MDQKFGESLLKGWQGDCPCCGRFAKIYKRAIHRSVALQLIRLYKLGGHNGEYIHASELIIEGQSGVGDLTKARYFGLIEEKPHEVGDKKSSGCWTLTDIGVAYVLKQRMIPSYVEVFNDRVIGRSDFLTGIDNALGRKFDYTALMNDQLI